MDAKLMRKDIDALIFQIEERQKGEQLSSDHGRAMSLVRTKLQEARMWSGKILEAENKPFPEEFRDHCDDRKNG